MLSDVVISHTAFAVTGFICYGRARQNIVSSFVTPVVSAVSEYNARFQATAGPAFRIDLIRLRFISVVKKLCTTRIRPLETIKQQL